jgi:hypothetical protein
MDKTQILQRLGAFDLLPVEAIEAARLQKEALIPEFVAIMREHAGREAGDWDESNLIFFAFHLLGEWREKSACGALVGFLRSPASELLGDAITETSHRVVAVLFDGDAEPLRDLILDQRADEYVRSRMLEAMAMLARAGQIPRDKTANFLRDCFSVFQREKGNFVWNGWQSAVALLGLEEFVPQVKEAFEGEWIDPGWLEFRHFERDLLDALERPGELAREFRRFGDVIEEFSSWHGFTQACLDERKRMRAEPLTDWRLSEPVINPLRNIGRNDPCPCGSGRKFKKCCLAQAA